MFGSVLNLEDMLLLVMNMAVKSSLTLSPKVSRTVAQPRPFPLWHPGARSPGRLKHLRGILTVPGPLKDQITTDQTSVKGTSTQLLCYGERCLFSRLENKNLFFFTGTSACLSSKQRDIFINSSSYSFPWKSSQLWAEELAWHVECVYKWVVFFCRIWQMACANKWPVFNQILVDCKPRRANGFYEIEHYLKSGAWSGACLKEPLDPHKTWNGAVATVSN